VAKGSHFLTLPDSNWLIDLRLLADLQTLQKLGHDHHALCAAARNFCSSDSADHLSRKIAAALERSTWHEIRHYIGRLGSWAKSAKELVRTAKKCILTSSTSVVSRCFLGLSGCQFQLLTTTQH